VREGYVWCVCRVAQDVAAALSLWRCRHGMAAMEREVDWQLCRAAECGDVAGISLALLAGANVNGHEGTGWWTPLQSAAWYGRLAAVKALLGAGAHMDGVTNGCVTPLMCAALNGHAATVATLLAGGADVHRMDDYASTALHWACTYGRVPCVRALLDAGARADVRDDDGKRPIDVVSAILRFAVVVGPQVVQCVCIACRCANRYGISPPPQPSPHC